MKFEQIKSVQEWLPFERILEYGIVELRDSSYIKIIKIKPINYNLKTKIEKEAILNSYKIFFKSINCNLQILIQSKKEDLKSNIDIVNKESNKKYNRLRTEYVNYIQDLNNQKKSSNKIFYIIIRNSALEIGNDECIKLLKDNYLKIKEMLSRCGNIVSEITDEKDTVEIIFSFLNPIKI